MRSWELKVQVGVLKGPTKDRFYISLFFFPLTPRLVYYPIKTWFEVSNTVQ